MPNLLTVPSEIRNHIWRHAFAYRNVTMDSDFFGDFRQNCRPCSTDTHYSLIKPFHFFFDPLLTCKQLYSEAHALFFSTLNLHAVTFGRRGIDIRCANLRKRTPGSRSDKLILEKIENLTVYLHIDDISRASWAALLLDTFNTCVKLKALTVYNHMRPPMKYDYLADAVFFAAPMVLANLSHRGITTSIHYDYIYEDVMFTSPLLGDIKCSDALQEHTQVVEDLMKDRAFQECASVDWDRDEEAMTAILVRIARSYEQVWFERLRRRRVEDIARREAEGPGEEMSL